MSNLIVRGCSQREYGIHYLLRRARTLILFLQVVGSLLSVGLLSGQNPPSKVKQTGLPSETPAQFQPVTNSFDYEKREVMIPMRDKVKLHTVILVPKGAAHAPILFHPYALQRLAADRPQCQRPPGTRPGRL